MLELPARGRNVLAIVPPYPSPSGPPAGAAALLGALKTNGCNEFDFLDLRLWTPEVRNPTYSPVGTFGETFVIDVPDLPLVLQLLQSYDDGRPLQPVVDAKFEEYCAARRLSSRFLASYLERMDRFLADVAAALPDVEFIGFSVWTMNYLTTLLAAAHLKRRKRPPFVVVGGPQVTESTCSAELGLASGLFDAVVLGEGEATLLALYQQFRGSGDGLASAIPGVLRRDPALGTFTRSERASIPLARLPLPAFEEMPLGAYRRRSLERRTLPYQLSRGCTDECTFCSEWVFWRHYRSDTVDHALDQIRTLVDRFGVEHIAFTDSLLNGHPARLRAFAEGVLALPRPVKWSGFMRAQMDDETAMLLSRAGCTGAFLGVESLDDETLDRMNKRRTGSENLAAIDSLLKARIPVIVGLIAGFPGDTRDRFQTTLRLLRDRARYAGGRLSVSIEPFLATPGQPLWGELERHGLFTVPWDAETLDLAPRYRMISERSSCRVEGSNQGLERIGQLRLGRAFAREIAGRAVRPTSASEHEIEAFDDLHAEMRPLREGWFALRLETARSFTFAALVTSAEKDSLDRIEEALRALEEATGVTAALMEAPAYLEELEAIERRHVIPPQRVRPRIEPSRFQRRLGAATRLVVSPHVVARAVPGSDEHPEGLLLVVDVVTLLATELPPSAEALLRFVSQEPQSADALAVRPALAALAEPSMLETLVEAGVLVVAERLASTSDSLVDAGEGLVRLTRRAH